MIKMFVSDIDGTMMQHGGIIDEEDVQALRKLAEEGVILCFASGRLDNEIAALMKDIGTNFHRISVNGVFVYTHDDEQLLNASFEPDILPELIAISNDEKFIRYISDEHDYYIEKKSPFILELEEKAKLHSVEEPELLDKIGKTIFPHKISIGGNEDALVELQQKIEDRFAGKVSTFISAKECLDIMPAGVSKGAAISVLLEQHGVRADEMACIGDSYNDIPMFQLTPHSFAMQDADEEVKRHAGHVAASVKEAVEYVRMYNQQTV